MTIPSSHCERARSWASLRADGELSELEQALLDTHLARCGECRAFAADLERIESLVRATPAETPSRPIEVRRLRRGRSLRVFQTAAVVAVLATTGLGAMITHMIGTGDVSQPPVQRVSEISGDTPQSYRAVRRWLAANDRPVPKHFAIP